MSQPNPPVHNRRNTDPKPELPSDHYARRFTQIMISLILAGVMSTFFKFIEWDGLAWSIVPVIMGLFIWLVITIIRLDNAIREEHHKDDDDSEPPLAPA